MKDYISEAKKINVHIYNAKYLQKYKIHKAAEYVELYYMNGSYDTKYLNEVTEEELKTKQRNDLRDIEKSVIEKTNFDIKVGSIASASYFALGTLFSIIRSSNIAIWFTWGSYFLFKALRPMKLRKDIALAGWIIDNEDKVNEVLREEVDSKRETSSNTNTLNIITPKYPTELVPYSEAMYEEGISLNNIDELDTKTLKKLKRKVLKKERRK